MKTIGQELRDAENGKERRRIFQERIEAIQRRKIYKQTPLKPLKREKRRKGEMYCERHETTRASYRVICFKCRRTYIWPDYFIMIQSGNMRKCECGSTDIQWIGPIARLPHKNASKKKWKEFWEHCGKNCAGRCR